MAQEKLSPEQLQNHFKEAMVTITEGVSFAYTEGISLEEFKKTLCNGQPVATEEGDAILNKAYEYLSKKISAEEIIKNDDGKLIGLGLKYFYENRKDVKADANGTELFGNNLAQNPQAKEGGCKWYQLWCHIKSFADWVVEHWDTIYKILQALGVLK